MTKEILHEMYKCNKCGTFAQSEIEYSCDRRRTIKIGCPNCKIYTKPQLATNAFRAKSEALYQWGKINKKVKPTEKITIENYQKEAMKFLLPSCENETYSTAGMIGEIGEVASLIAKAKRKEVDIDLTNAKKELGDCMWFLALYAHLCGKNFSDFIDKKGDFKIKFTVKIEDNAGKKDECSFNLSEFKDSNELDLVECLQMNIDKLADRKARGVIIGNGDNR